MNQISGKPNVFKFIGTYNPESETFVIDVPLDTDDFEFEVDNDGTCYVWTNQKWEYDQETGAFYLIKEVN